MSNVPRSSLTIVACPAEPLSQRLVQPPARLVMWALPAVASNETVTWPPRFSMVALPAVALPRKSIDPPACATRVARPAEALSWNWTKPPLPGWAAPAVICRLSASALPLKTRPAPLLTPTGPVPTAPVAPTFNVPPSICVPPL
ncbi:hypothetical protein D3C86_1721370 [compost metagenome]